MFPVFIAVMVPPLLELLGLPMGLRPPLLFSSPVDGRGLIIGFIVLFVFLSSTTLIGSLLTLSVLDFVSSCVVCFLVWILFCEDDFKSFILSLSVVLFLSTVFVSTTCLFISIVSGSAVLVLADFLILCFLIVVFCVCFVLDRLGSFHEYLYVLLVLPLTTTRMSTVCKVFLCTLIDVLLRLLTERLGTAVLPSYITRLLLTFPKPLPFILYPSVVEIIELILGTTSLVVVLVFVLFFF